jgi:electron transport complex protein RnfD
MRFETAPAPHVVAGFTVPRVMFLVLLALVPAGVAHVAVLGPGLLLHLVVAAPVALGCEAAALGLRRRPAGPALRDGSVLVTAALLAFCLPPLLPWWLTALGTAVAVLLGKHVYGGLGYNPFNPAMVGYAVLLISFPVAMTRWPLIGAELDWPTLARLTVHSFYAGVPPPDLSWDAWTGATALDVLRTGLRQRLTMQEIRAGGPFGALGGGRVGLDQPRRARRRVLPAAAWHRSMADPDRVLAGNRGSGRARSRARPGQPPGRRLSPALGRYDAGRILHRHGPRVRRQQRSGAPFLWSRIGILTWVIRRWGSYPDGLAFAVLLMNLAVPLIDRYTIPRIYGQARD